MCSVLTTFFFKNLRRKKGRVSERVTNSGDSVGLGTHEL